MRKRISLSELEINVIVQCIEGQKNIGTSGIPKDIGVKFMEDLISKLLKDRSGDVSIMPQKA